MRLIPILAFAATLHAQTLTESVTVEVVDVPVYVRSDGKPVTGLTRDDFELIVNGKPQAIEYFDEVGNAAIDPSVPPSMRQAALLRERRLFLLVFDLSFTKPYRVGQARLAALKLVESAGPRDYFGIATNTPTEGVRYILPFTRDVAALKLALMQLQARQTHDPLSLVAPLPTRADLVPNEPIEPDNIDPNEAPLADWTLAHSKDVTREQSVEDAITPRGAAQVELYTSRSPIQGLLEGLAGAANRLRPMQGQKHVILISQGFDVTAFNDYRSTSRKPDLYMVQQFEEMYGYFRAAGVFLHTLDPGGLKPDTLGTDSLFILASGTGGQAMNDRNDLRAALSDIAGAYSHGYLLGFRRVNARKEANRIEVKVKRRGVSVTHRRGFDGTTPALDPNNGLYLADIVQNDVPQTGLQSGIEIRSGRVSARLPMREIAAQLNHRGSVDLMVYLFDLQGRPVDFRRRAVAVTKNDVEVVDLQLGLRPGAYILKTLLRVGDSIGFTRAPLKVGANTKGVAPREERSTPAAPAPPRPPSPR